MSHILVGADAYWSEFLGIFGVEGECASAILCIKANGDVKLETIMKDGTQYHINGLAPRSFLIHLLETLNVSVANHVLEICIDARAGQIVTVTYTCAGDNRIKDVNWNEIEIFHDELR